ncbi:C25 family cysteine peptidase [Tolypothrix campylonemoides VB511288_2]|uniref:C25 family cysteine peptidase n=1 Tax=Tolypothrix campylonemoides VB511288_2 TaxID=3232311 RepID=A0ABW8XPV0_9CYAN
MELVVTNRSRLINKYGELGWQTIKQEIDKYLEALYNVGEFQADIFFIDELIDKGEEEPKRIKAELRSLYEKYSAKYLLLLGGDDIVPFYRLSDNTPDRDIDFHIFSDTYYSDFQTRKMDHWPVMGVGRLPDGGNNAELLVNQIQGSVKLHQKGGVPISNNHIGFSTERWELASRRTYARISRDNQQLFLSPPLGLKKNLVNGVTEVINSSYFPAPSNILFFNLHGEHDQAIWYGERRITSGKITLMYFLPELINHELFNKIPLTNSILLCEACHGSAIHNGRTPMNSLALCALQQGASAFFGCTGTSYAAFLPQSGPSGESGIDAIFQTLIHSLIVKGLTFGDALKETKQFYQIHSAQDKKNILGLTLLGDPMLRFQLEENSNG